MHEDLSPKPYRHTRTAMLPAADSIYPSAVIVPTHRSHTAHGLYACVPFVCIDTSREESCKHNMRPRPVQATSNSLAFAHDANLSSSHTRLSDMNVCFIDSDIGVLRNFPVRTYARGPLKIRDLIAWGCGREEILLPKTS